MTENGTGFRLKSFQGGFFGRWKGKGASFKMGPSGYQGREQSYIKHQFLSQYLREAAYKVLQGKSRVFNFVDGFAGPWRVAAEDYTDASFDQAVRTLEPVRKDLEVRGIGSRKIRFCFCERRDVAVARLREYARANWQFEIHIFHGSFEDRLEDVALACRDGFTFSFIDPTGWNVRSDRILEFLKNQRGEFLLNFMAEHINRHAEYSVVARSFGRFLADPEWKEEFGKLPSEWNNEERVLYLLRRKIKESGAAKFVPDFPISKPLENRIKMRLLLGTFSKKGLEVFRDVQKKVENEEIETRIRLRGRGHPSMFSDDEAAALQQEAAGVGCPPFQRKAEERIVDNLSRNGEQAFSEVAIDVLEVVPVRMTNVRKLVSNLEGKGILTYELPPRKRLPQDRTVISLANLV